ncbi:hypothetical protein pdam_00001189 [Pocillopora damicornis]|uniref:G domain-containing protein n=1 Tax=Pocillopora damicornis TaxID=46731 RepID=A0A3M6TL52_POCDA|nr:hypothetical protein pdam_00001189 [Pocillopora damicornis]
MRRRELRKTPSLIFIGERNCGKSSIINKLLKQTNRPVHENPCSQRQRESKALDATVKVGLNHELLKSGIELMDSPGKNKTDVSDSVGRFPREKHSSSFCVRKMRLRPSVSLTSCILNVTSHRDFITGESSKTCDLFHTISVNSSNSSNSSRSHHENTDLKDRSSPPGFTRKLCERCPAAKIPNHSGSIHRTRNYETGVPDRK